MEIEEVSAEEFLKSRGFEPLAVGQNFNVSCPFLSLSRPVGTSDRDLANYMKMIREGLKWGDRDFSKMALVYSEREYMYFLVEC